MEIRLLSVPHSGTRSTMRILEDAGIKPIQVHFSGSRDIRIYGRQEPAIIPIRDKEEVRRSWVKRGKTGAGFNLDESWREMEQYIDENDVYPFRIDDPDQRDKDLQAISELLGVPLTADYSVKVGENGT